MKRLLPILVGLLGLAFVPAAAASTVSYIAGDTIWLSSPDGSQKKQLTGSAGDGHEWTEQTQADNGKLLAVRREPGKIATLNRFTLFSPSGGVLQQGSLTNEPGWFTSAFPVSLDLTDDGVAVYGYSNTTLGYSSFEQGTYVRTVEKPFTMQPLKIVGWEWPTLFGDRLVATQGDQIWLQAPGEGTPFAPSPDVGFLQVPSGPTINRTDIAANGKLIGIELNYKIIELYPITRVPDVTPQAGDNVVGDGGCVLPTQGDASHITISQDGKDIAWEDDRGVVSAGAPVFAAGVDPCQLSRPPVILAPNGKYPSIGAAVLSNPGGGGGNGSGAPAPTVPKVIKAAKLKGGVWITVKVPKAGKVTATGKVGRQVIARGAVTAKKAGSVRIKLKAVKKFRNKLNRFKGKSMVVKVTSGGKSKTVKRVLK